MKIELESNLLREMFRDVYFINGTAYAGKSTMVRLLAERFGGICCGENYHAALEGLIDVQHQPNLSYFQTMSGWPEFLNRAPEDYDAWISGTSREAAELEILQLIRLSQEGRPIFVDTNISVELLREIAEWDHVAIMLSPQRVSVERFFDRGDPEKQFLLGQIAQTDDPEKTMENFRACIARINDDDHRRVFEDSGFFLVHRDDERTPEETMAILAKHFCLE